MQLKKPMSDGQTLFIGYFWPRSGIQSENKLIERHC